MVERTWAGGREWWVAEGSGLRQSWTIDARPDGLGPLAIELALGGATARATDDGLLLNTPGGATLSYTGLLAWDATGRSLPARLAPSAGGVSVRVDDTDAVYPVVVDPLVEDATWSWSADAYSNSMGTRLASGDFNGDGHGDLIAAALRFYGDLFVFYSDGTGLPATYDDVIAVAPDYLYMDAFDNVGDLNSDGYDDVAVGSTTSTTYGAAANTVYVYYGSAAFGSYWFDSLDGGFDADDDGYDDLIIGAPGSGRAYLYRGSASGMHDSPDTTLLRPDSSATYYGETVVGVPDVTGDGADDVVVADTAWGGHQGGLWMYASVADADADGWSNAYDCDDTNPSVLPWHCGDSRDLVVDGTSVTLSGDYDYRAVWVVNGGRITVRPYSGFRGTGFVSYSAEVVYVDASSSITATGAGYAGGAAGTAGSGSGAGGGSGSGWGGGGGFGGKGGWGMTTCASNSGTQGARYGSSTDGSLTMGSGGGGGQGGGSYEGRGGRGGGAIGLYADLVRIEGALHANGQLRTRPGYTLTGGAGSGGTVLISAGTFECSGTITAMGGNVPTATAAGSGGPGGGGRVQFGYDLGDYDACTFNVQQGTGGCAANASQVGSAMVLP